MKAKNIIILVINFLLIINIEAQSCWKLVSSTSDCYLKIVQTDKNSYLANANYQITNAIGQTCLQGKFTEKLDVSALKSGVYFFKTETGTQRFVKE